MKTLVLATALFSLPAFAENFNIKCMAEADLNADHKIIYEAWGTQDLADEGASFALTQDGFNVSVKSYDMANDSYQTFLGAGSLQLIPDENCLENCDISSFAVPESVNGLTITYSVSEKTFNVVHIWDKKRVIEASGICVVEKIPAQQEQEQEGSEQGGEG